MRFFMIRILSLLFFTVMAVGTKAQSASPSRLVIIETRLGDMIIMLSDSTPLHRDNFIKIIEQGFYDSLMFHRVMRNFMIQGGDPDSRKAQPGQRLGNSGPGYTIPAEFKRGLYHHRGVLAAARQPDEVNPTKASSGSQFYIVHGRRFSDMELDAMENRMGRKMTTEMRQAYKTMGGAPHLDGGYTVFGEVLEGFETIDKIAAQSVDAANRPAQDIRMKIRVIR